MYLPYPWPSAVMVAPVESQNLNQIMWYFIFPFHFCTRTGEPRLQKFGFKGFVPEINCTKLQIVPRKIVPVIKVGKLGLNPFFCIVLLYFCTVLYILGSAYQCIGFIFVLENLDEKRFQNGVLHIRWTGVYSEILDLTMNFKRFFTVIGSLTCRSSCETF